jgi:hypothetical protein
MIERLAGKRNSLEYRLWSPWMEAASELADRFIDLDPDDDPFAYNETASVSFLCTAAGQAGYIALAEYATTKKAMKDHRRSAPGRCDLWLHAEQVEWAFEFKRLFPRQFPRKRLDTAWNAAMGCAGCLRKDAADRRVGGLIVSLYWMEEQIRERTRGLARSFAKECDLAWEITTKRAVAPDTFLMFGLVA